MREALLTAKEITKAYPGAQEPVLNQISAEIYPRDFTIIMGPSGAGKSTLLYALSGMDALSGGKVLYRDQSWEPCRKRRWQNCGPRNSALFSSRPIW